MGGYEGSQRAMARNLHQNPLVLNPPCPTPTGGAPVVLWTSILLCPGPGSSRGFGGAGTFPLRSAVSFGQCWLPAPAVAVGCGSQWVCFPTAAPRPHSSLSFLSFPLLQDLLPAPTSWRPLSWISKRQESQNQMQTLKTTNESGRQPRAVPACPRQWVSMVRWLLSLNKELGPRLKAKTHHRILLQGGNQPWQHEQYPQCKRMETGIFLPMGKAINQP